MSLVLNGKSVVDEEEQGLKNNQEKEELETPVDDCSEDSDRSQSSWDRSLSCAYPDVFGKRHDADARSLANKADALSFFLEIEAKVAEAKNIIKEYEKAIEHLANFWGTENLFQAPNGHVYKVVNSQGRFIYNQKYQLKTTRQEIEPNGKRKQRTLSLAEAQKAGFEVK